MRHVIFAIIATLLIGCTTSQTHPYRAKSAFAQYDDEFQRTIGRNWDALLNQKNLKTGEIVLTFHLTCDGHITDMKVTHDGVGNGQALICEKAVMSSVPYPPWPADMVHMVGKNYREVIFTFYYQPEPHWQWW